MNKEIKENVHCAEMTADEMEKAAGGVTIQISADKEHQSGKMSGELYWKFSQTPETVIKCPACGSTSLNCNGGLNFSCLNCGTAFDFRRS